jgi:BCD family chlorophyll transporter-like MFS transporter
VVSAVVFGLLRADFSALRLIKVIQGAALVTVVLNGIALWKQEPRSPGRTARDLPRQSFSESWALYAGKGRARRRLVATGLGTAAFSMQDILLEPYGGQILHLPVAATTALTALLAAGGGLGLLVAARWLDRGGDAFRVAASGAVVGIAAFSAVVFAAPLDSARLFAVGVALIGVGGGLFAHGTLTASMAKAGPEDTGLALGAWGAVQASAAGLAIAASGILRDLGAHLAESGHLGEALNLPSTGYLIVYHIEIALLFATLLAIGPLVRAESRTHLPRSLPRSA